MSLRPGGHNIERRIRLGCRYLYKYWVDDFLDACRLDSFSSKPLDILCEVTYQCNLKCLTCFRWASKPDSIELGFEDWCGIITKLNDWLGMFNLSFSGGEPFLRKDFLEICGFAAGRGLPVSVISNGSLIDRSLAENIVSSGIDAVSLSLNSLNPEIHNKTRGTATSFSEVMSALNNLKDRGRMRLSINTTVIKENIDGLIALVEFVRSEGLDGINFQPVMEASVFSVHQSKGEAEGSFYRGLGKDTDKVDMVFERLISMRNTGYPINNSVLHLKYMAQYLKEPHASGGAGLLCKIGRKNFFIDPYGNVRICMLMDTIGNIATTAPSEIWNSGNASRQRSMILGCTKNCSLLSCNFKRLDPGYRIKRILQAATKRPE